MHRLPIEGCPVTEGKAACYRCGGNWPGTKTPREKLAKGILSGTLDPKRLGCGLLSEMAADAKSVRDKLIRENPIVGAVDYSRAITIIPEDECRKGIDTMQQIAEKKYKGQRVSVVRIDRGGAYIGDALSEALCSEPNPARMSHYVNNQRVDPPVCLSPPDFERFFVGRNGHRNPIDTIVIADNVAESKTSLDGLVKEIQRGWPQFSNRQPPPIDIPRNCPKCSPLVMKLFKEYKRTGDVKLFDGLDCECKEIWEQDLSK